MSGLKKAKFHASLFLCRLLKPIAKRISINLLQKALATIAELIPLAKADGKKVRAYLSVVFSCPL